MRIVASLIKISHEKSTENQQQTIFLRQMENYFRKIIIFSKIAGNDKQQAANEKSAENHQQTIFLEAS